MVREVRPGVGQSGFGEVVVCGADNSKSMLGLIAQYFDVYATR